MTGFALTALVLQIFAKKRQKTLTPTTMVPTEVSPKPVQFVPKSDRFWMTQDDIIGMVRENKATYDWIDLPGYPGIQVFRDALRIDSIRVPVSARTTASIADILSRNLGKKILPTTAMIEDAVHANATNKVIPSTFDPSRLGQNVLTSVHAVVTSSQDIDNQITNKGLVSCVGKSWILSNLVLTHPGRAINYGMFRPDGPYLSVTGKYKLWQQPSWAHDPDHWDYSQTCRLMKIAEGVVLPENITTENLWVSPA